MGIIKETAGIKIGNIKAIKIVSLNGILKKVSE